MQLEKLEGYKCELLQRGLEVTICEKAQIIQDMIEMGRFDVDFIRDTAAEIIGTLNTFELLKKELGIEVQE